MSEQQISTAVAVRPENRRWVSDPVPAITEAAATGETAAIFADIRQVLGVDVVNLIWRHLATIDGALPWAWGTLRPLYADGSVISEATALHKALALPPMPAIPAEVFAGLGLHADDLAAIRGVLAAYDHTNAMAAVARTALRARLDGRTPHDSAAAEPAPVAATARIGLPKLLDLTDMQAGTAALVTALNGFGTRRPGRSWRACIGILPTGRRICRLPGCCSRRSTATGYWQPRSNRCGTRHRFGRTDCWSGWPPRRRRPRRLRRSARPSSRSPGT
jgi:hypothetical protein